MNTEHTKNTRFAKYIGNYFTALGFRWKVLNVVPLDKVPHYQCESVDDGMRPVANVLVAYFPCDPIGACEPRIAEENA